MFGTWTYLVFELGWACPVLFLQWAVGWKTLRARRRPLVWSVLISTAYLSSADGIAISHGIWTLHRSRIVGLYAVNVPAEEIIFFLLTNLLVVQSVLLVYRPIPGSLLWRLTRGGKWYKHNANL
jgi:lycopene cyclase domain-containing protein